MDYLLSDEPFDEDRCRSLIDSRVKASSNGFYFFRRSNQRLHLHPIKNGIGMLIIYVNAIFDKTRFCLCAFRLGKIKIFGKYIDVIVSPWYNFFRMFDNFLTVCKKGGSITNNGKNRQCPVTVGLSLRQTLPGTESSGDRKAGKYGKPAGKTSAARCQLWKTYRSVRLIQRMSR